MKHMIYDEDFIKAEVRCGYEVSVQLKKIWAVELDLLQQLLAVCRAHGIRVYAFAGTLLGAIRHKGFIPWDDDLDVCMSREDYTRLIRLRDAFQYPYFLQTGDTDPRYHFGYARLRNSETTGMIRYNIVENYNNGIYIDIHVLDGLTDDRLKRLMQRREMDILSKLLNLYNADVRLTNDFQRRSGGQRLILRLLRATLFRLVSRRRLSDRYDRVIQRYNGKTERVSMLTHPEWFVERYWCRPGDLEQGLEWPFEYMTIPVPANYDAILTNIYGDYMTFPPAEERGKWHNDQILFDPDRPYTEYINRKKEESHESTDP